MVAQAQNASSWEAEVTGEQVLIKSLNQQQLTGGSPSLQQP